jgi:hypothetical protein
MTIGAVCAGGLVALGAILDLLCSAEEKARLRVLLEAKLYRFRYVTPRSFGREEMTFAIGLLERVFGSRFWSWRRWIVAIEPERVRGGSALSRRASASI